MSYLTSENTVKWARIAGCIGILCFFLPFLRVRIFGETDSYSGFKYLFAILKNLDDYERLDAEFKTINLWLIGALVAGITGVVSSIIMRGGLFSAIVDVLGVGCLFFLRDEYIFSVRDIGSMGGGWTLALIAYILAAVFAFVSWFLAGREYANRRPGGISAMSDEEFDKLKKELNDIRVDDSDKK